MPKVVTATEAKNRLGSLMSEVLASNEPIIIELRGRPKIAIVTTERLREIEELERKERHRLALENLERIRQEITERHEREGIPELSEEEAMDLAVEAVREIRAERAAREIKAHA
jgi:prevent-host-death family protein